MLDDCGFSVAIEDFEDKNTPDPKSNKKAEIGMHLQRQYLAVMSCFLKHILTYYLPAHPMSVDDESLIARGLGMTCI